MDYEHVAQKNVMVLALGMDSKEKGLKKHVFFFFLWNFIKLSVLRKVWLLKEKTRARGISLHADVYVRRDVCIGSQRCRHDKGRSSVGTPKGSCSNPWRWRTRLLSSVAAQNPCFALQEEIHCDLEKVGCLYFLCSFSWVKKGEKKPSLVSGTVTFLLLQNRLCVFVRYFTVLKKRHKYQFKGKKRNNVN